MLHKNRAGCEKTDSLPQRLNVCRIWRTNDLAKRKAKNKRRQSNYLQPTLDLVKRRQRSKGAENFCISCLEIIRSSIEGPARGHRDGLSPNHSFADGFFF